MTPNELIESALMKIGVLGVGESATGDQVSHALRALNAMLKRWQQDNLAALATTRETFSLTAGTAEYTIGSSGDFDTTRPVSIEGAYLTDSTISYPLDLISLRDYREIEDKDTESIPTAMVYIPENPLGILIFWPVPDTGYTLNLHSIKPFADITVADIGTDMSLPEGWDEALIYNLATRLGEDYGVPPAASIFARAADDLDAIKRNNMARRVSEVGFDFPVFNT